jgi:hypothetical protein
MRFPYLQFEAVVISFVAQRTSREFAASSIMIGFWLFALHIDISAISEATASGSGILAQGRKGSQRTHLRQVVARSPKPLPTVDRASC